MNQEVDGVRKVYHYLHNIASGLTIGGFSSDKTFLVDLPLSKDNPNWFPFVLDIDRRDKRTLVVFDGHIPYGGLSKGTSVVLTIPAFAVLRTRFEYLRKKRPEEENENYVWFTGDAFANFAIDRYFLLVPKTTICIRRYDARSFRPIYTFIQVNEKEVRKVQPKGVTWMNSSH